uniref:Ovule protein n=1 Tax=Caenorhabditis tropicalis TaxID=1561998 RepID=A0A1I7UHY0_9PELO
MEHLTIQTDEFQDQFHNCCSPASVDSSYSSCSSVEDEIEIYTRLVRNEAPLRKDFFREMSKNSSCSSSFDYGIRSIYSIDQHFDFRRIRTIFLSERIQNYGCRPRQSLQFSRG